MNLVHIPIRNCILFGLVIFIQLHCKKDVSDAELPPITQIGKNTFGCKVAGKVWVANRECGFNLSGCNAMLVEVERAWADSALPVAITMILGNQNPDSKSFITIISKNIQFPPMSYIRGTGNIYDSVIVSYISDSSTYFSGPVGTMDISKLDTLNGIIAGTFTCTLQAGPGKTIAVTDGRFDMKFMACSCVH